MSQKIHVCSALSLWNIFFERKWLLTRFSSAFVVFPGGFGTLDEFFEVLTQIMTNKLSRVPIVLVGKEYWSPFRAFAYE